MTNRVWWFLLFLFLILGLVASLLYFWFRKDSNNKRLWLIWGFGVAGYAFIASVILFAISKPHGGDTKAQNAEVTKDGVGNKFQDAKSHYQDLREKAATRDDCKTDKQNCLEAAIQNPKLSGMSRTLAINQCDKQADSNDCTSSVTQACDDAMKAKQDALLYDQFQQFKGKHSTSEVLAFCNGALKQ